MIEVNDGGATISTDNGKTWSTQDNQPTAQFYRVALDNEYPYWAYGAQQDNSTVKIQTRADGTGINERNWYEVVAARAAGFNRIRGIQTWFTRAPTMACSPATSIAPGSCATSRFGRTIPWVRARRP